MRLRTWPVAALALCALLILVVVAVLESSRRAQEIYSRLDAINQRYHEVEAKLRRLRSDVNLSGIFIRDYLLDPARERAPHYRRRIAEYRRTNMATFAELDALTRGQEEVDQRLNRLRTRLDDYWRTVDPLFDLIPTEKAGTRAKFLRDEELPRREAVLAIASEIEELNNATIAAQRTAVSQQQAELRTHLQRVLWITLLLGVVVAVTAVYRLRRLEDRSDEQRAEAEAAERQMRQLSQQLVATQEKERTKLSRELHDHVGQMLTALRMELGTIDRLRDAGDAPMARSVAEGRNLVDTMVRLVRDLALGLRPSMLDDWGVQAALEWHARDFTRRNEIPVDLQVVGDLDRLPDQHRTAVDRIIQEALTNCARHARAERIRIRLQGDAGSLEVTVVDDGHGFDVTHRMGAWGYTESRNACANSRERCGSAALRESGTTLGSACPSRTGPPGRLPLRVLLADDHGIVRRGLRALLESEPGITVVAEAADGLETLRLVTEHHPDILIVDVGMPKLNGIDVTARTQKLDRAPRSIILSMHSDELGHHPGARGRRARVPLEGCHRRRSAAGRADRHTGQTILQPRRDRRAGRGLRPPPADKRAQRPVSHADRSRERGLTAPRRGTVEQGSRQHCSISVCRPSRRIAAI